jgi:hypothetical protein
VAAGGVRRSWFWGPAPNTGGLTEEYRQGAGGKRLVQYFDKSRMEINDPGADPASPWYVTNGLLTVELISGRVQTGESSFTQRAPAEVNVTGDAGDKSAPTYASFAPVSNAGEEHRDPDRTGQYVTATLDRAGRVGADPGKAGQPGARIIYYENLTGHNIPAAMWGFLNMSGPVEVGGKAVQQKLNEPWFYASGLPISDPYWAQATIGGTLTAVLVQAYERRVLTYVPSNPEGFQVEMGNVGQHYYDWRYGSAPGPGPQPAPTEPPTTAPGPLPRFAIEPNGDVSSAALDGIVGAGGGVVRVEMQWSSIEPSNVPPAQYNWSAMDQRLKRIADKGLTPIVLVAGCPSWACTFASGPVRVEYVSAFAEFMAAVAGRYGKAPYNAHYWEFWNEPDSFTGEANRYNWGMHPDRYAAMFAAIRPGMKTADPYAKLVMGGLAYDNFQEQGGPFNRAFLDGFLDAGGGQYMDVFNFHYYVQNANWCSLAAKLAELRAKLAAHHVNVPIICTETGFTSSSQYQSNTETQSLYLAQAYAQALGEGMASVAWYTAKDFQTSVPGWQIFKDSGLLDANGNPKPSYQAFKWAVSQLSERNPVRALSAGDGVSAPTRGYEFAADKTHAGGLWVVWAWDFSVYTPCGSMPAPLSFSIPASKASRVNRVLDMYGQPIATRALGDGSLAFQLDARPVYIEWK